MRKRFKYFADPIAYGVLTKQVQIRLAEKIVNKIDRMAKEKGFKSRSDAVRAIISYYEEREKTQEFFKMLVSRSQEARKHPEMRIPLARAAHRRSPRHL
jgi:Arc/MetJ-type ribon-helix-helix transcriptional regulator